METSYKRSLLYSLGFHLLLLALLLILYNSFLVVRTPLLMDLTLIGEMSQGSGLGSPSSHAGETPSQLPAAETNGEFSTPAKEIANPPLQTNPNPEVAVKKPLKSQIHPGRSPKESYLESLHQSAPIGLEAKKDEPQEIKTTAGLGHIGVAGTPDGSAKIEGELAGRSIKRQVNPVYPDWAKKQGVEAVVRFRLTVLPNGFLKMDDLQLDQTSGYRELDTDVYEALIQWEFTPLPPESPQVDQGGVISFAFSLKN